MRKVKITIEVEDFGKGEMEFKYSDQAIATLGWEALFIESSVTTAANLARNMPEPKIIIFEGRS